MTKKERELLERCIQAWDDIRHGASKEKACLCHQIATKEYDANIAAALKERDKYIRQCRYYYGETDYPFYDGSKLNYYWAIERMYVSLLGDIPDDIDYVSCIKREYPGIPRGILHYMFFRWGKGVVGIPESIQSFYDQVDKYLELADPPFPKDKIPDGLPVPSDD